MRRGSRHPIAMPRRHHMASQIAAGLDGIVTDADPGPSAETPYSADAPALPKTLMDYFMHLKEFEISRFLAAVTDWEHREYFALL